VADKLGYDDTPLIPGQKWKVHDDTRPQPRVVTPGTAGSPPSDAVVLFDGTDLSGWECTKGGDAAWTVENGYMEVAPKSGSIRTKAEFGDCQLHVELAAPEEVIGDSQGRGNSGVFMMGIYEIQVLDCYDNPTYADGTSAGIYGQFPPLVNACRKPGEWQTYDIVWVGPKFDGDKLVSPARATIFQNGLLIHHDVVLTGPTTHRAVLEYEPQPATGPLELQDHGDKVRFRNIWYRPLTGYDEV
jgi:3-keto-disaccharide hydrolase